MTTTVMLLDATNWMFEPDLFRQMFLVTTGVLIVAQACRLILGGW